MVTVPTTSVSLSVDQTITQRPRRHIGDRSSVTYGDIGYHGYQDIEVWGDHQLMGYTISVHGAVIINPGPTPYGRR
jgi:hypothetical protein